MKGFYFITDAAQSLRGNGDDVRQAVKAGAAAVQYRAKRASARAMYEEAAALKELCGGVRFIVNDRVDIALAVNADGVHLGEEDIPYEKARTILGGRRIIGLTVRSLEEALRAAEKQADYISVGPIYATATKSDAGPPVGISLIKEIRRECDITLVAIGGITPGNAPDVVSAGADCVCAVSAVVKSTDVYGEIKKYQMLFK